MSEGIFANALRFLSLSPAPGSLPGTVHKGGVPQGGVGGGLEQGGGGLAGGDGGVGEDGVGRGGQDTSSSSSSISPSPEEEEEEAAAAAAAAAAHVKGSVRQGGLAWEALEGDSVLPSRLARSQRLLEGPPRVIDIDSLRAACWSGIPARYRVATWQMLLGYLPLQRDRQVPTLARRKEDYRKEEAGRRGGAYVGRNEGEQAMLRQVLVDVPRTCPEIPLFRCDWMQRSLERVLSTFATRHPAMSYVQGLNDLATPFYAVFLSPWLDPWGAKDVAGAVQPGSLEDVEADVYWCLTKLLEGIQDHYTPSQPGIQRMIHQMRELVHRIDEPLVKHLEGNHIDFQAFAFRWMNCLLLRELPLPLIVRLWDTYIAEARNGAIRDGFHTFHVYVCGALLLHFSKPLLALSGVGELLPFLQKLPTRDWGHREMEQIISQAFVHKSCFGASKAHLFDS